MGLEQREHEVEQARKRLEARAKALGIRVEDLRDERADLLDRAHDKAERERELEKKLKQKHRLESLWTERGCIDGATTWKGLVLVLNVVEARTAWAGGVNAADRTSHADDCGDKSSQQELYDLFLAGLGAPANPPGTGSHEGICDDDLSRAGFGSIGSKLPPWAWGLDLQDGPGFEHGAEQLGFKVARVYPNEPWHCNLAEDPMPVLRRLGIV